MSLLRPNGFTGTYYVFIKGFLQSIPVKHLQDVMRYSPATVIRRIAICLKKSEKFTFWCLIVVGHSCSRRMGFGKFRGKVHGEE